MHLGKRPVGSLHSPHLALESFCGNGCTPPAHSALLRAHHAVEDPGRVHPGQRIHSLEPANVGVGVRQDVQLERSNRDRVGGSARTSTLMFQLSLLDASSINIEIKA